MSECKSVALSDIHISLFMFVTNDDLEHKPVVQSKPPVSDSLSLDDRLFEIIKYIVLNDIGYEIILDVDDVPLLNQNPRHWNKKIANLIFIIIYYYNE